MRRPISRPTFTSGWPSWGKLVWGEPSWGEPYWEGLSQEEPPYPGPSYVGPSWPEPSAVYVWTRPSSQLLPLCLDAILRDFRLSHNPYRGSSTSAKYSAASLLLPVDR